LRKYNAIKNVRNLSDDQLRQKRKMIMHDFVSFV